MGVCKHVEMEDEGQKTAKAGQLAHARVFLTISDVRGSKTVRIFTKTSLLLQF